RAQAVAREQQRRLGLLRRGGNRLAGEVMNAATVTPGGNLAAIPDDIRRQLLQAGIVLVGPGSGIVVNAAMTGAVPSNYTPPTLDALLASEDDEGIEAAIRQRDAGVYMGGSGFPMGCVTVLAMEGQRRHGPLRYVS